VRQVVCESGYQLTSVVELCDTGAFVSAVHWRRCITSTFGGLLSAAGRLGLLSAVADRLSHMPAPNDSYHLHFAAYCSLK
jgi:hypothetical protein